LGGRRLDQAVEVLVAGGLAEVDGSAPVVVLRSRKEGSP